MIKPIEAMMTSIQRSSPPKMARPANIPPNSQMHILITNHRSGMAKTRMSRIRNDIATNLSMSPMAFRFFYKYRNAREIFHTLR